VSSLVNYYQIGQKGWTAQLSRKEMPVTPLVLTFVLTGGTLLLFALMPGSFFEFVSAADKEQFGGMGLGASFIAAVEDVRKSIFTADCRRSLLVILVGVVALWLYAARKLKAMPLVAVLAVVCFVDLWQINKRYLNDSMFRDQSVKAEAHQQTQLDAYLLKDQTLDYRVLNLTTNPFNENNTSYYHKSVGGYHAAKLGRYQNLIDSCLMKEMGYAQQAVMLPDSVSDQYIPVINMLNTRYVIGVAEDRAVPLRNENAFGNAWLVNKVHYVDNANEELAALYQVDLRHEAVADKRFQTVLGQGASQDSTTMVRMDSYEPNRLKYTVQSATGGVLVFSEIYYPHGWQALVDGKQVELGRVNYVLRALKIAPGQHQVELNFFPQSVKTMDSVSYAAQVAFLLLFVLACVLSYRQLKRKG